MRSVKWVVSPLYYMGRSAENPRCVVFDLDGVLFDNTRRKEAYQSDICNKISNADQCYEDGIYFAHDSVIRDAPNIVNSCSSNHQIIYLTGRRETSRAETIKSLSAHGFPKGILYLKPRKKDDTQEYKRRVLTTLVSKYDVVAYYDDDTANTEIGDSLGIPSYQELPGGVINE